ncbi:MAG TPA: DNA recombination protein RmuC [Jatrophihabitantaceae bacterium]
MDVIIIGIVLAAGIAIGYLVAAQRAERRASTGASLRDVIGAEAADALERVQEQLVTLDRGRVRSEVALSEQMRMMAESSHLLRSEAAQLVTALRAPHVRGRWGEMQLERVVEAAGMTEHVDFDTQVSLTGDGTTQRPDLVVHLSGGKQVVVDAKVAFSAYLEALEAADEPTRNARMRAHAKQLRSHIDALAAKAYWQRFTPTPEFVVCFVPADTFLDAALRADPSLLEHAFTQNVVLATPSTLVALLRTVAYTWRQEALARNAEAVHELGRELYRRLATMGGHVERLGRSLGGAVAAYNDAVGSLERRVLSTARRMNDLGVVAADARLTAPEPLLDAVPRPFSSAELGELPRKSSPESAQSPRIA